MNRSPAPSQSCPDGGLHGVTLPLEVHELDALGDGGLTVDHQTARRGAILFVSIVLRG